MASSSDSPWTITSESAIDSPEIDQVHSWLREFNWNANPAFMKLATQDESFSHPLLLLARHEGILVGGLIGERVLAWLKISIMAVDPAYRGRGVGTSLLLDAEQRAREMGCQYLYADTMQYQAPHFYTTRGFQIAGQIPNWDSHGHTKFFLTKEL